MKTGILHTTYYCAVECSRGIGRMPSRLKEQQLLVLVPRHHPPTALLTVVDLVSLLWWGSMPSHFCKIGLKSYSDSIKQA